MVRNPLKDLHEEEKEESNSEKDSSTADTEPTESRIMVEHMKLVQELLMELQGGQMYLGAYMESTLELTVNTALNNLNLEDFPALWRAWVQLTVKGQDPKLDVIFWSWITAMAGVLNLYLDSQLSFKWWDASLIVAKLMGKGIQDGNKWARNLHTWIHKYLATGKFLTHHHGQHLVSILDDEDFTQDIQEHLQEIAKEGYVQAQDIIDYILTPAIQEKLGMKKWAISIWTACCWLKKLNWHYGCKKNGTYIDGHEREDVVEYRNQFIKRWREDEKRMVMYDNNKNMDLIPSGFPVPQGHWFQLILVTHDKSTFYANDRRKTKWSHVSEKVAPQKKGKGPSLMISDMLTLEWGWLVHGDE